MRKVWLGAACALSLVVTLGSAVLTSAAPAAAKPDPGDGRYALDVYTGELTQQQFESLRSLGIEDIATSPGTAGRVKVETILSQQQINRLAGQGLPLKPKLIRGKPAAEVLRSQLAAGQNVFRSYSEPGGIRDELVAGGGRPSRAGQAGARSAAP